MNNLVSVIIPAYNHENYIQETIKSIINQTYKNIELIIIDDGSKDNTWQKIKELEEECKKRFVNVYFETKENEGTCKILNKLISKSSGDFIYLIASDDISKPQAIEKEISFLSNNPDCVLVVGDNELIDKNSNIIGWDKEKNIIKYEEAEFKTFGDFLKYNNKDIDFNSKQFGEYSTLLKGNYIPNGYLIKKDAILKYPFTPEAPLEDYYIMLQLSKIGKFKFINEALFSYRIHDSNTSKNVKKMLKITKQTLLYEKSLIKNNKKFKNIFYSAIYNIKYKINLGFIKYYKRLDFLESKKEYVLQIFNKEFVIKSKNLL